MPSKLPTLLRSDNFLLTCDISSSGHTTCFRPPNMGNQPSQDLQNPRLQLPMRLIGSMKIEGPGHMQKALDFQQRKQTSKTMPHHFWATSLGNKHAPKFLQQRRHSNESAHPVPEKEHVIRVRGLHMNVFGLFSHSSTSRKNASLQSRRIQLTLVRFA